MTEFKAKMHQIRSAWAPPQTPLRELTALPRPTSWIWGPLRGRGGAGLGKRRERGGGVSAWREGKGRPPSFCWTRAPQSLVTPLIVRIHFALYSHSGAAVHVADKKKHSSCLPWYQLPEKCRPCYPRLICNHCHFVAYVYVQRVYSRVH